MTYQSFVPLFIIVAVEYCALRATTLLETLGVALISVALVKVIEAEPVPICMMVTCEPTVQPVPGTVSVALFPVSSTSFPSFVVASDPPEATEATEM